MIPHDWIKTTNDTVMWVCSRCKMAVECPIPGCPDAYMQPSCSQIVSKVEMALVDCISALVALRDIVKTVPELQKRDYISVGIKVHEAITKGELALLDSARGPNAQRDSLHVSNSFEKQWFALMTELLMHGNFISGRCSWAQLQEELQEMKRNRGMHTGRSVQIDSG